MITSFQHNMLLQMAWLCSSSWLSTIPFYVCTTFIHPFLHQWTSRLLLNVLVMVNSIAVNIVLHVFFFQFRAFSRYMPRSRIVRWNGKSIFSFLKNLFIVLTVVVPIYIPSNSVRWFPFFPQLFHHSLLVDCWWIPFWMVWGDTSS